MPQAQVNNINIAYEERGSGTPLVLVHGFPLDKRMWELQLEGLSRRFRVIAVDLRGHGESDAGTVPYSMDLFADDLKGLLDALQIRRAAVCGFSMGGYAVFAFCRKYPQRLQALILADTRPQPDTEEAKAGRETGAQTALTQGTKGITDGFLGRLITAEHRDSRPDLVDKLRTIMESTPAAAVAADLRAMAARPDSVPTLAQITVPTLVIVGDQDGVTPPADAQLMAEQIRGATLVTIGNAAHASNLEQAEAFNEAIASFLAAVPAATD